MEQEIQNQEADFSDFYKYHPSFEAQQGLELIKVLTDHEDLLDVMRLQLRGEQIYQTKDGERMAIQIDKPMFCKLDEKNVPIKRYNEKTKTWDYVTNDEAINEIVSILKFCGLNPVAPMTTIDENEIRADLMEMESKISVLLCIKRKKWGIDKAEYPTIVGKIKVLLKDSRYRSKDGVVLRALRTITTRMEQSREAYDKKKNLMQRIKSPFA